MKNRAYKRGIGDETGGRRVRAVGIVLPGILAASLLLLMGSIIGIGVPRGVYGWPVAYGLFVAATAISTGFCAWRLSSYFRQVEHERERYFTLGLDMYAVTDFRGRIIRVNPAFTSALGWTCAEVESRPFLEFVHPDDHGKTSSEIEKLQNGCPVLEFENRCRCKDGSWRVLAWRSAPSLEHGHIYAAARDVTAAREAEETLPGSDESGSAMHRSIGDDAPRDDVTELTTAERSLAETQEWLEISVRAGNVGFWDWNMQTDEVQFSSQYKRQLGYAAYELDGRYDEWADLLHPDDRDRAVAAVEQYVTQARGPYAQEFRLRHKDGSYRWIHAQGAMVPGRDGERRMVGTHIDITERKQLESQFIEAQKMESVGSLAGGVAHDFNNLLSVINGYSDLALQGLSEDDPIRCDIQEVRKAGSRAADLTRQLLAFSRHQLLKPKVMDVSAHLTDFSKMLGRLVGDEVEVRVESAPELGKVKMDPGQLEQIVTNLAMNSRDAMPHGGTLTIQLQNVSRDEIPAAGSEKPEDYVRLTISDNGSGMDAATMEKIFEPFYTTKRDGRGTGLGLAAVFGIVKQSDGYIHAFSEAGCGTSFHIFLPIVDEAPKRVVRKRETVAPSGGATVLLVEDEENLRRLTERLLSKAGYRVLAAQSGDEAIQIARSASPKPDLLFTDVVMVGLSGPELAQRMKGIVPGIKLLFMSGYAGDALAQHYSIVESDHFIAKPFNAAQLIEKVQEVLASTTVATDR